MEKPKRSIRRFDVFAEYQRLEGLKDKQPEDVAKGYGIWLAKLVAARRFGSGSKSSAGSSKNKGSDDTASRELVDGKWRTLDDEPQTDALFDKEIIERMGREFYEGIFSPAVEQAFREGKDYKDIRDEIRKDWKPK